MKKAKTPKPGDLRMVVGAAFRQRPEDLDFPKGCYVTRRVVTILAIKEVGRQKGWCEMALVATHKGEVGWIFAALAKTITPQLVKFLRQV